jgi:hypothetical protein
MEQSAERRGARDRLTDDVAEPVDVMAGLGEQRERGLAGAAPVATHERMREVVPTDRFGVRHADDLAKLGEEFLERLGVRRVPHDMADRDRRAGPGGNLANGNGFGLGRRDWLLEQDIVALLGKHRRRLQMH